MKFVNDNPAPPNEVTVTFPFDPFIAIMRLIGNSSRHHLVEVCEFVTDDECDNLENIYREFSRSEYYQFYGRKK